jgi:hypothetical protein
MPTPSVAAAVVQKLGLLAACLAVVWFLFGPVALVYLLSYAYHAVNLQAFLFRRERADVYLATSLILRGVAIATLLFLMAPFVSGPWNYYALAAIAAGTVLHAFSVQALGLRRTYYAVELGAAASARTKAFPYNLLAHPMEIGAGLQFVGLYFVLPEFTLAWPYLVLGHLAFTVVTALVEELNLHFRNYFFTAQIGRFTRENAQHTIDGLRDWSLDHFREHLHKSCSMHAYVKTLPADAIAQIDRVRYADEIMEHLNCAFPGSQVNPLPMTDEFYISRYNIDRGGDQGLFDKHHDGNLRFLPASSVVRSLIYLSSQDHLEVVFDTSGKAAQMKTYDYGLLDFHKELHWVNGSYDPNNPPRILLKCNYYIDHSGLSFWRRLGIGLNIAVFYSVKAAMEYSKSPQTVFQRCVGMMCNVFRRLNNFSPAAPIVLVVGVLVVTLKLFALQVAHLF